MGRSEILQRITSDAASNLQFLLHTVEVAGSNPAVPIVISMT
jgi:hypothetical protein